MPRIKKGWDEIPRPQHPGLVAALADELRHSREAGQPRIEEQLFPKTNALRVLVLWDEWDTLPDEDRAEVILQAYEQAEGRGFRDRIGLAIGLTFPEAYESGLLPYKIMAMVRATDRVTWQQCQQAILKQGASQLFEPSRLELRFATPEEAEACRNRLAKELPGSDEVWAITQEVARIGQ